MLGFAVRFDELRRADIFAYPLQRNAQGLAALNSFEAAIPTRQPLRGDCSQHRQDQPHQRQCGKGLNQREAAISPFHRLACADHWVCLLNRRMVSKLTTEPVGDWTWTLIFSGTHGISTGAPSRSTATGSMSARHECCIVKTDRTCATGSERAGRSSHRTLLPA